MLLSMSVHKVSVSLDEDAFTAAKEEAVAEGVSLSLWLSRAAAHHARTQAGLRAVAERNARSTDPLTDEDRREGDRILDELGVGRV